MLGFAISALVQAWVPRERIEALMSGSDARSIGWATGLGAASSSCSYAAIAIAKSLFQKGRTRPRRSRSSSRRRTSCGSSDFVSRDLEQQAREHAREADTGHQHHMAGEQLSWRERMTSARAWSDVAHNSRYRSSRAC